MIHLATLPTCKMTQNKVGLFPIFENPASSGPYCAKTGPNTPPIFLYFIWYMLDLTENHSLVWLNFVAHCLIWGQTWSIFEKYKIGEIPNLPNFPQAKPFNVSA